MKRIAILGCENSHASEFLKLMAEGKYPDMECIGVYSNKEGAAEKLHERYGVPIMERSDALVGQLDGLIITARDGKYHYPYAKPYLKSGIPMFIDKPITCDPSEAMRLVKEAKAKGVRLCGGSVAAFWPDTLKLKEYAEGSKGILGGCLAAPLHMDSPHSGFWFYAQHLVQMCLTIFGKDLRAVTARRDGGRVSVLFHYDAFDVSGLYLTENAYHGQVIAKEGSKSREITACSETFAEELDAIQSLMNGAPMEEGYEELIRPVFVMDGIYKAYHTGDTVKIEEISL